MPGFMTRNLGHCRRKEIAILRENFAVQEWLARNLSRFYARANNLTRFSFAKKIAGKFRRSQILPERIKMIKFVSGWSVQLSELGSVYQFV